ncbi:unnamed protein product [Cochlearia groenlandica]
MSTFMGVRCVRKTVAAILSICALSSKKIKGLLLFKNIFYNGSQLMRAAAAILVAFLALAGAARTHPFLIRGMEGLDLREKGKAAWTSPSGQDWNQFGVPGSRFVRSPY